LINLLSASERVFATFHHSDYALLNHFRVDAAMIERKGLPFFTTYDSLFRIAEDRDVGIVGGENKLR
jgi:hypothetical protein